MSPKLTYDKSPVLRNLSNRVDTQQSRKTMTFQRYGLAALLGNTFTKKFCNTYHLKHVIFKIS